MYKIFDHSELLKVKKKTPFYLYDVELLEDTLQEVVGAATSVLKHKFHIHYALKANDNKKILSMINDCALGADCVSGGEIKKARNAGFRSSDIVFAGVGKTDYEIKLALKNNIYAFNVESLEEIEVINVLAQKLGVCASIMIRVNPNIDAKTHRHISTGKHADKFGIAFSDVLASLDKIKNMQNINLIGLHYHIGSQITDFKVFQELIALINVHYKTLEEQKIHITDLNIGGGLGIDYINPELHPISDFKEYFRTIGEYLTVPFSVKLHFELGRSIIAQCGVLISQVLYTKTTASTNFAIIDAGMNDLMRPALYEAQHKIVKLSNQSNLERLRTNYIITSSQEIASQSCDNLASTTNIKLMQYNIVGPICESTDVFARNLQVEELKRGDKVVIYSVGAYGRVLANRYNSRLLIKEFFM